MQEEIASFGATKRGQLSFKNETTGKAFLKLPHKHTNKCFAAFSPVNIGNKFQLEKTLRLTRQVNAFPSASGC